MLLAAVLGAGGAVGLLVIAVPGALASVVGEGPAAARSAGPPPASEVVLPGTVVAGSSCVTAGAHDVVAVLLDGVRREVPLDSCGGIVGSSTTVRMLAAPDPSGPRVPHGAARVLGTGGTAPLVDPADPGRAASASPMAARITVTLTALAGLAMAGLLVTIGREGLRSRAAGTAPADRPAPRPTSARPTSSSPTSASSRAATSTPRTTGAGAPPRTSAPGRPGPSPVAPDTGAPEPIDSAAPGASGANPADVDPAAADHAGADPDAAGTNGPAARPRSRARSLRAPHPVRPVRGDGRLGPGTERARRGPSDRSRPRRPR